MDQHQEVFTVLATWLATVLALSIVGFLTKYTGNFARSVIIAWIILTPCLIALTRMLSRVAQRGLLSRGIGVRRVAIAGLNPLGQQVAENINNDAGLGLKVYGFFDDRSRLRDAEEDLDTKLEAISNANLHHHPLTTSLESQATDAPANQPTFAAESIETTPLAGGLDTLVDLARNGTVDIVLLTLPMRAESRIRYVLDRLSDSTVSVYIVPDFFVFELLHSRWTSVGGLPAVSVFENPLYGVDGVMKRAVDVALAITALATAFIPMTLIAICIKMTSRGPIFFRQRRYGLDGREIKVWKFRSMTVCDDGPAVKQATKGDARITPLGAILRRTSLDELPQLFNVLDGSMSLVGPRPHASAHNEHYRGQIRGYMLRHKVKPGITGLAQVSGCRGETDTIDKMERRIEWDHRYIRTWSLWLDIKILAKTLLVAWRQPEAF
jgi:putative colanic acid biosysnthesis UDP-glucose lipid carrier transferase